MYSPIGVRFDSSPSTLYREKTMSDIEKLPYETEMLFPMPVYKTNIGREFTKQEQDEFDTIIEKDLDKQYVEAKYLQRISADKYLLKRKPLASIQSFIDHHLKQFAADIMGIYDPNISLDITQSWLKATEPQQFYPSHSHGNSIISGVFYPKCLELPGGKQDAILFFRDEKTSIFKTLWVTKKHQTTFSRELFRYTIVTGDLVLFPSSSMNHAVERNDTTDQTRISLAFNTYLFGVLGDYETTSELILKQEK